MAPITLISGPPPLITPAEHRQLATSTPASFSDIPPVLRHKEEGIAVTLEPLLEGLSTEDCAKGTLYVTENVLAFFSDTGKGFQIDYPTITLHAIARGETGQTIYCQLDEAAGADVAVTDAEELQNMRELRLILTNPASVEPIFEALSLCAALHPDPQGSEDGMDSDDAFIDAGEGRFEAFTGDETQELSEVGRASLAYLESIIDDPHNMLPPSQEGLEKLTEDPTTKINGNRG